MRLLRSRPDRVNKDNVQASLPRLHVSEAAKAFKPQCESYKSILHRVLLNWPDPGKAVKAHVMSEIHYTQMPFGGAPLDYAEDKRTPEHIQKFLAMPSARAVLLHKGKAGIGKNGRLHHAHPSELIGQNLYEPGPIFLGLEGGSKPILAASLQDVKDFLPEDNFIDLRMGGAKMHADDLSIAGRAKSLFDWHRSHRYCANCGGGSVADDMGAKRVCNHCGTEHFPRVNPVVIMLVTYGDKLLLGRGVGWPDKAMSALAGFVSPGETIEEAVSREVFEEVGVKTKHSTYIFSQPWPYPSQLMLGMICEAYGTEITVNTDELDDAQWFTREEVDFAINGNDKDKAAFARPPKTTIARQLLEYWLSQTA